MHFQLLVPTGIGDFSWIWSKLSTTSDTFEILHPRETPARLDPFLALLPKDRILSYAVEPNAGFFFDRRELKAQFCNAPGEPIQRYDQMREGSINVVEANTHLERGNRIESWLPDIPAVDFHYRIEGLLEKTARANIFIVHLSSRQVQKTWHYYDIPVWISMIQRVQKQTGWTPVFIGGAYDDFARECFEKYAGTGAKTFSLIGKTPDLLSALCLIQQCKFFMGCVSSGLTMLANVLSTPSVSWWPRPGLPPAWHDKRIPYLWFRWKDPRSDREHLSLFLKGLHEN